jgi:CubicO group peptidase (beta-lactamase class C family)
LGVPLFPPVWPSGARRFRHLSLALALALASAFPSAPLRAAAPFAWESATPESRGLSSARLDSLRDQLVAHATKALLIVRDDRIVYEWYAPDHSATKLHFTASMAKALVGGMAVAVALSDGRLTLDDPAARYIPQWRDDPQKVKITLRQLGSHTSGLDDAKNNDTAHPALTGWKGDFWKRLPPPRDPFTLARDEVPVVFPPGTRMLYSNPGIAALALATTAALKDAPEKDLRTVLRDRVMRPIGAPDSEWNVGYGGTVEVDGLPLVGSWGGANYTARTTARVGRLMLREGDWDGRRVLAAGAVRAVVSDPQTGGSGGIGWWSNHAGQVACLPRDAYWGAGAQHQTLLVVPSLKLIVVRNGGALSSSLEYDRARDTLLFQPLMQALSPPTP